MKHFIYAKLTAFLLVIAASVAYAQNRQFTMQEATLGLNTSLAPANLQQLQWIPGTNDFTFYDTVTKAFQEASCNNLKPTKGLSLRQLNASLFQRDSLKNMPDIKWKSAKQGYCNIKNDFYYITQTTLEGNMPSTIWLSSKWASLPEDAQNIEVDTAHDLIAYTVKNNLFSFDKNKTTHQITNDTNENIISGQAVHRNEFGIDKGIFISPKGNYIAFYRMDQTMVADYPVIDWSVTPAVNHNIKYPMAGGTSHQVTLGVYNPATNQTVYLQTGEPKDHYLTCVTWSPDEKYIFIAILNREQNHLWLNKYDAQTGAFVKTLFEETDDKYVEPQHPLAFLPGSDNEFLWWSQRSGFMHLYRYNTDGKLLNAVTSDNWLVNEIAGFNQKKKEVIFTANKESPLSKNIYKANWETGKITRLDDAPGVHTALTSSSGEYVIDNYQNYETPRQISVIDADKKSEKGILTAANPLAGYQQANIKEVTLKADDGTPLYGRLILPTNFDEHKKYPVIVYLYNGPHVQLIQNTFPECGNLWYEYLAQHGYIVYTMDGRGSSNRGLKFEQATFRHLGTEEMNDQLKGVDYLRSLPYVDTARMGVHGWSFGGFMTTSLMLRHPGIFKCAVAGGPVMDWSMYEVMYTERYMDTPQENPQGYADNDLITKVQNLKGKLLLIHGTQDATVVWQHSIKFLKACVDNGVQIDYFVYPGYEHNVRGKDRTHLMQKITDYFDEYLKK